VVTPDSSGDSIEAVIIENAFGRQTIAAKLFVDATERADVVARAGAPLKSAGNEKGLPGSIFVDVQGQRSRYGRLFEYQSFDPALWTAIAKARAAGDIPEGRRRQEGSAGPADSTTVDAGGDCVH
jgi:hypothetical protein